MSRITALPWDSGHFGFPAARLDEPSPDDLGDVLLQADREGIAHISTRIDASQIKLATALADHGFALVDGLLTFSRKLADLEPKPDCGIRAGQPEDAEAAAEIGRRAFLIDRFHNDPYLPPGVADELHAEWCKNSFSGGTAGASVVAFDPTGQSQDIYGFVTMKLSGNVGTIVLVAVAPQAQGRGLGRRLTEAALREMKLRGIEEARVGTQMANTAAARLYEGLGFRLIGSSLSFARFTPRLPEPT